MAGGRLTQLDRDGASRPAFEMGGHWRGWDRGGGAGINEGVLAPEREGDRRSGGRGGGWRGDSRKTSEKAMDAQTKSADRATRERELGAAKTPNSGVHSRLPRRRPVVHRGESGLCSRHPRGR